MDNNLHPPESQRFSAMCCGEAAEDAPTRVVPTLYPK